MAAIIPARFVPGLVGGVPGYHLPIGRQSSNALKIARIDTAPPITGVSTSGVTIGLGVQNFTVDLSASKGSYGTNDVIRYSSGANPTVDWVQGPVNSLVGNNLQLNVTSKGGSGLHNDWIKTTHLPPGASFGAKRMILNADTFDFDFRGLDTRYLINVAGVTFSESLLDLSVYTTANLAFIYTQGAAVYWTGRNLSIDGKNSTVAITRCIGSDNNNGQPDLLEGIDCINWPADLISGIPGIVGRKQTRRNSRFQSGSSAISNFHTDGEQLVGVQTDLEIHNVEYDVRQLFSNGTTVTGPLNISRIPDYAGRIYLHDLILRGGSFSLFTGDSGGTPTGAFDVERIWCADDLFGVLYSNQKADPILKLSNVYDLYTGARRSFAHNDGSSTTTKFVI